MRSDRIIKGEETGGQESKGKQCQERSGANKAMEKEETKRQIGWWEGRQAAWCCVCGRVCGVHGNKMGLNTSKMDLGAFKMGSLNIACFFADFSTPKHYASWESQLACCLGSQCVLWVMCDVLLCSTQQRDDRVDPQRNKNDGLFC